MVNTSEEEALEEIGMQERQLKHKNMLPAFGFFDKSTLAWLTVGLIIGHQPFVVIMRKALLQALL